MTIYKNEIVLMDVDETAKYLNIKNPPITGPMVVPKELNPWARFNRAEADFSGPRIATYGFAAICRRVKPKPNTNKALKKKPYM